MKQLTYRFRTLIAMMVFCFLQLTTFAQDATTSSETSSSTTKVEITNDNAGDWFNNNWVWVVGAIVFVVLLIALMGGRSSSRSTTVVRDDTGTGRVSRTTTVDEDL